MKKVSIAATRQSRNISQQRLTIGLDLGGRNSWYCVLDEAGQIQLEQQVRTTAKALQEASHRGDREEAGGVAASPVGERRSSGACVNGLARVPLLSETKGRQTDGSTG